MIYPLLSAGAAFRDLDPETSGSEKPGRRHIEGAMIGPGPGSDKSDARWRETLHLPGGNVDVMPVYRTFAICRDASRVTRGEI